ncbi:DUF2087 domain-containing protein [Curtobacterium sp. MCPF17_050]|uniref:DUF2087 domain-containing protein n=1 Tax=Curtobacterium sp. MCPF17_050 TaxID=2175664 RepID=UPI000D962F07|nr:DUF2087 domain-containing protein [Curtobacterium sp. MCPF17_050]WIB15913.1 DUF2087 domain-containing protein [Curtobacterium sp. MCPF17_050]
MSTHSALRRARQVVAATMKPTIPADRFDWVGADGTVDTGLLRETKEAIELLLTDRAVLHVGRIRDLPIEAGGRQELSSAIVRTVFDRLPARRSISEETLNAALAMFVEDVALVRRDAVDTGVVTRSADGSSYSLQAPQAKS